jgi:hypothetical protein
LSLFPEPRVIRLRGRKGTEEVDAGEGNGSRLNAELLQDGSERVVESDEGVAREREGRGDRGGRASESKLGDEPASETG